MTRVRGKHMVGMRSVYTAACILSWLLQIRSYIYRPCTTCYYGRIRSDDSSIINTGALPYHNVGGVGALGGSRSIHGSGGSGFGGAGKLSPKATNEMRPRARNDEQIQQVVVEKYCPTLNTSFPGLRVIHSDPLVLEISNFFDDSLCDEYIQRATEMGDRYNSQTFAANTATQRTSTTWYLKYEHVPEFLFKVNQLTNKPIETYEEPQVVKYELGQQFSWHYDALPPNLNKNGGQRVATLIVYLNSVATGGATVFKDLQLSVRPVKGKALLFFPCAADGTPDDRTIHAGQIAGDTKWIAQLWIHQHPYAPGIPAGTSHASGIEAVNAFKLGHKVWLS